MHLGGLIARHGRYRADHTAVVFEGERLGYAAFNKRANRLANALLARGLKKGDKIATVVPNCLELLTLYWAVSKTGMVVVPMSPLLTAKGLAKLLRDSDAAAVLTHPTTHAAVAEAVADLAQQLPPGTRLIAGGSADGFTPLSVITAVAGDAAPPAPGLTGEDLFNITYSSGTTGEPKGIMHSHFVRSMYGALFSSALRIAPESVVMHSGAIIFNGAFVTMMPAFFAGATFVLQKQFDAGAFIEAVEREGVTHVMLVPTQIIELLGHKDFTPDRVGSLQMILSLGAPLHLEHKQALAERLPGRFHELYGVTEGFVVILDKTDFARKPNSVGIPTPGFEVRVVDPEARDLPPGEVGEIIGRGPILMAGYYKRPDLTAATLRDGWLYSGDLGYLDEDGYLYLVDRKKDMIISGGINVYPRDIEEIAVRHPAVAEVAVYGVPDAKWGETPVAAIVAKPGADINAEDLRSWINERVEARFQKLSAVKLLDAFPRNAAGKILKRDLREGAKDG